MSLTANWPFSIDVDSLSIDFTCHILLWSMFHSIRLVICSFSLSVDWTLISSCSFSMDVDWLWIDRALNSHRFVTWLMNGPLKRVNKEPALITLSEGGTDDTTDINWQFSFVCLCCRNRQSSRKPVPDQRQREETHGAAGTHRNCGQPLGEGLRPRQRVPRCNFASDFPLFIPLRCHQLLSFARFSQLLAI